MVSVEHIFWKVYCGVSYYESSHTSPSNRSWIRWTLLHLWNQVPLSLMVMGQWVQWQGKPSTTSVEATSPSWTMAPGTPTPAWCATCRSCSNSWPTSRSRPCVPCVSTGWRIWFSFADMVLVRCVGTGCPSVQSAGRVQLDVSSN